MAPPPGNITIKGLREKAVRPKVVTAIGSYEAPMGTFTESDVGDDVTTKALTSPKNTMLLAELLLKPVPEIITVVPVGPNAGAKELITG